MTDTDKLTEILIEMSSQDFHGDTPKQRVQHMRVAHSAILDWAKSLAPEEKPESEYETDYEFWERKYWNACRSQLLAKIEGLRK